MTDVQVCFDAADVQRFADASGDRSPLHLDRDYARRTPMGAPVVHGALAAAATLSGLGRDAARVAGLVVSFHHPVRIGQHYLVTPDPGPRAVLGEQGSDRLVLRLGSMAVCSVRYRLARDANDASPLSGLPPAGPPRTLNGAALAALGPENADYGATSLGLIGAGRPGSRLPAHLLGLLAWASFWVGMRTPGATALWCGLTAEFAPTAAAGGGRSRPHRISAALQAPRWDARTGMLALSGQLSGALDVRVHLDAHCRPPTPRPDATSMRAYTTGARRLDGRTVAVVGGSRGLGRAITFHLAARGARVLVISRAARAELTSADTRSAGRRLDVVAIDADATDPAGMSGALADVAGGLAGLVLCSAAAIPSLPLDPAAADAAMDYVSESVRHCWVPLAAGRRQLHDDAFVVLISSAVVEDAPPLWLHYAAAKGAVEALATHVARRHPWRTVLARPPRLWTDLTNTPTGRLGAQPVEQVADWILRAVDAAPTSRHRAQVLTWPSGHEAVDGRRAP